MTKELLAFSLLLFSSVAFGQIAINTTGNNANASAMLDVESTTKGMLVPRMTSVQRTAITTPAMGLLVYDNTTLSFWFYNGTAWTELVTAANTWKLNGNSGTNPATNFIGTTDNQPLILKINGQPAGRINTSPSFTSYGYLAGSAGGGYANSFFGDQAGMNNTNGYRNTVLGSQAMLNNTDGFENTAVGSSALFSNQTGSYNTSVGFSTLSYNNSGYSNVAMGWTAMLNNTSGHSNTGIGTFALMSNTVGANNVAMGRQAMFNNTTGYSNVALGAAALYAATTKSNLVAVGDSALLNNGTGSTNAVQSTYNVAVGTKSLYTNTIGYENTAIGSQTLYSNTSGNENSALGAFSLNGNTTGGNNSAVGYYSLNSNTFGNYNSAFGGHALGANTGGHNNTAIGFNSLGNSTAGTDNTALGYFAMSGATSYGAGNTAVGELADVATGINNATAIGIRSYASASNSLVLGSISGVNGAGSDVNVGIGVTAPAGRLHIKHNSYPTPTVLLEETEDDYVRMQFRNTNANSFWEINPKPNLTAANARVEFWNTSSGAGGVQFTIFGNGNATLSGTLTQSSDARLKQNIQPINNALNAITRLNGYTYNWKDANSDPSLQMGVIAQEVQKVFPSLVRQDDKGMLSVNYSGLIPVLIEAIKEQQKQIDELKQLLQK